MEYYDIVSNFLEIPEKYQKELVSHFGNRLSKFESLAVFDSLIEFAREQLEDPYNYGFVEKLNDKTLLLYVKQELNKDIEFLLYDKKEKTYKVFRLEDELTFPTECDSEDCGCPCYEYCKDKMLGVDHFCCEDVYEKYLAEERSKNNEQI